jgi:hypothetical protein
VVADLVVAVVSALAWRTRVCGLDAVERQFRLLRDSSQGRRLLLYYWIEDVVPRLVIARATGTELDVDTVSVCDDTWPGRLIAKVLAKLQRRSLPLRLSHGMLGVKDLQVLIRERAPLSIAADGRGPYGRVHPSLARLVQSRDAIAIPVSVLASPCLRARLAGRIAVPVPGARLAIALGSPVLPDGERGLSSEDLERGLREARDGSRSLLAGRPSASETWRN